MKKILLSVLLLLALAFPGHLFAAAGSCVQGDVTGVYSGNQLAGKTLSFVCTFGTGADVATALTSVVTTANMAQLTGWYLDMGWTYNGATAPTALYDIYLRETVGAVDDAVDVLGTAGMNRPGTAAVSSQFRPIKDTTYLVPGPRQITNNLKLTTSGNLVESGSFTVVFGFVR